MKTLPLPDPDAPSREMFELFLEACRGEAEEVGQSLLVSISLEVDALDPLAVLESIFESTETHFFAERPSDGWAIAGAEAVLQCDAAGVDRFTICQRFFDDVLARTIAVGEVERRFSGPQFLGGFSFFDAVENEEPFPAARFFVPRWQVARDRERTIATANFLVEPDADLAALADRVWRAHEKFRSFDYSTPDFSEHGRVPVAAGDLAVRELGGDDAYRAAVARAAAMIGEGRFHKIVLARCKEIAAGAPLHPLQVLNGLRQQFPDCYAFSFANGRGQSFIGASPERLVRIEDRTLTTEALAGSAPRGRSASEDAALTSGLLRSEKDRREHQLVVASIARRLAPLGIAIDADAVRPGLRRLANVQHLHTPIAAALPSGVRPLDVLARLHPTPAVGGSPREAAVAHIRELESFPRGLYGGALGWVDHRGEAEFFVGIRSALIDGARARVFAGGGIVQGSDPAAEWAETELKFRALLGALLPRV